MSATMAAALNRIAQLSADPPVTAWRDEDAAEFYRTQLMAAIAIATLALPPLASDSDMASALRYIRERYGRLDGVGWDRLAIERPDFNEGCGDLTCPACYVQDDISLAGKPCKWTPADADIAEGGL